MSRNISINIEQLDFTKPVEFYAKFFNIPVSTLRRFFKKHGVYNNFDSITENAVITKSRIKQLEYNLSPQKCLNCKNPLSYKKRKNRYCSHSCSSTYIQKDRPNCRWGEKDKKRISEWMKKYGYRRTVEKKTVICLNCNSIINSVPSDKRKFCSKKCYEHYVRKTGCLKGGKSGGIRQKSGIGKQGWYKGYYCNSSWELAWIIYNLDHNIKFERNLIGFQYLYNDKYHKFYPDFKLIDSDEFIEIKGFKSKQVEAKLYNFPHKITVLYKNDIKKYIDYTVSKYGKDYIKLYEIKN